MLASPDRRRAARPHRASARGRGRLTALEARGLTVRFGRGQRRLTAVDRVDLTVPERTTVGLVGESGSGKSTLARALVGLVPIAEGEVRLDDEQVPVRRSGRVTDRRRRVQMIFQDPFASLNPRMTVGAAIAEALTVRGGHERTGRSLAVRHYLELVHLDPDVATSPPGILSGGQRQRVAIARALAANPEVLIADEITSSLDVSVQSAVLNLMRELQRDLGLTVVFVSHNLATVRYVSDVIAVMYLGRLVEVGPTDDVVLRPQHPYTRTLLDAVPRLGERMLTGEDESESGEPPDPHAPPSGCHFHPRCPIGPMAFPERQICIERDPREGSEARPHHAACHFAAETSSLQSHPETQEVRGVAHDR